MSDLKILHTESGQQVVDYEYAKNLIEQQQARISELEQREVELSAMLEKVKELWRDGLNAVKREAYREGFMSSCEGFNGELYEDGWRKVIDVFNQELNQRYPDKE